MGTPESSMPSDAFAVARTSHWRHTAFGIPKQTSIAASKVPAVGYHHSPAGRHKSADEMALPSAVQSGSISHGARTEGPIQKAAGVCVIGEATCDGR